MKFEGPVDQDPEVKKQRDLAIPTAPSKSLASYVVLYRHLGFEKEFATKCMQELVQRRQQGDDFNYEEYIETELTKLPKPQNLTNSIDMVKSTLISKLMKMKP